MSTPSNPDPDDRSTNDRTPDDRTTSDRSVDASASPDDVAGERATADGASAAPSGAPERTSALGTATGQHAAARPYPPSSPSRPDDALTAPLGADRPAGRLSDPPTETLGRPDPSQTAVLPPAQAPSPAPIAAQTAGAGPAPAAAATGAPAATTAGATRDRRDLRDEARVVHEDLPERPRKPGFGRHLLGTLLGLLLTPVALLLVGIGTARLDDVAGSGDPATDALGLTLLVLGTLLLAVIVLLGVWSPSVPIVGGLVWGIGLGVAYLAVPGLMADTVDSMVGERVLPAAVEQLTESAVSGQLLVTGTLLLAAGVAAARARRTGRRWAEAVATADSARTDVARRDAERAADRTAATR